MVGVVSAEMTTTTKGFVQAAATSDMYEVEAGRIAERRAQSAQVKDFARHMVEAHTETSEQAEIRPGAATTFTSRRRPISTTAARA